MDAVILAAGVGSRIRPIHDLPKGFIRVGSSPLIEQSIKILQFYGIKNILIVTGYRANFYNNLVSSENGVKTILNNNYESTGSLYSLILAKNWVKGDFLLLESDILYDEIAIGNLLQENRPNVIVTTGESHSGDEVYVETKEDYLVNMSKGKKDLHIANITGELVGISKLSLQSYQALVEETEKNLESAKKDHYETGLVSLTSKFPIYCLKIPQLLWCEIDDEHHLERAKKIYLPMRKNTKIF